MRPTKMRISALVLALIMALSFTACLDAGNNYSGGNTNAPPPSTSAEASAASPIEASTPTPDNTSQIKEKPAEIIKTKLAAAEVPAAAEPAPMPKSTVASLSYPADILSDLTVHFLDVGQADAILIQLPNGQVMLIDGGNSVDSNRIMSYMHTHGVTAIDYLVATHPHSDHIGGLPSIIDSIDIGSVYMPRVSHNTQAFERLLTSIQNKGLRIDMATAGRNILTIPDLRIDILAPNRDDYSDLNDHSAVIMITYVDTTFLFMGDAEALSESHITADVFADVLKVGHHGSDTSTSQEFLNRVMPACGVISVGIINSYGHPTDTVLSRLNDAAVDVYRTDLQGTIVIKSDGKLITVNIEPTKYQVPTPEATTELTAEPATEPATAPEHIPEPAPELKETPKTESVMVWLPGTGLKYHSINNCGNMNPSRARQVTLEVAKISYDPCSRCNPPR